MCGLDISERVELKLMRRRLLRTYLAIDPADTPDAILLNMEIEAIDDLLACPGYGYS